MIRLAGPASEVIAVGTLDGEEGRDESIDVQQDINLLPADRESEVDWREWMQAWFVAPRELGYGLEFRWRLWENVKQRLSRRWADLCHLADELDDGLTEGRRVEKILQEGYSGFQPNASFQYPMPVTTEDLRFLHFRRWSERRHNPPIWRPLRLADFATREENPTEKRKIAGAAVHLSCHAEHDWFSSATVGQSSPGGADGAALTLHSSKDVS